MNASVAAFLPGGRRLHLQHGPIDLIIETWGEAFQRDRAHRAAIARFDSILDELVGELELLRQPPSSAGPRPEGAVARRMLAAVRPVAAEGAFVTPMAAVAGAVAEEVLDHMLAAADLDKAYVNNGGDIALHLGQGERFDVAMIALGAVPADDGRVTIEAADRVRGIATSGRHGRSLSMGIADSVTVLAESAAMADAAATLLANAVDLPGHPAVERRPAVSVRSDSDLGERLVVIGLGELTTDDIERALERGLRAAEGMRAAGRIAAAALFLRGRSMVAEAVGGSATCRLPGALQVEGAQAMRA
jgi:hypothetical protein